MDVAIVSMFTEFTLLSVSGVTASYGYDVVKAKRERVRAKKVGSVPECPRCAQVDRDLADLAGDMAKAADRLAKLTNATEKEEKR